VRKMSTGKLRTLSGIERIEHKCYTASMPPEITQFLSYLVIGLGGALLLVVLGALLGKLFASWAGELLHAFGIQL